LRQGVFLVPLLWAVLGLSVSADTLPIRIDAPRNGEVYVKKVGEAHSYELLNNTTPATYESEPGDRIDIRVVAEDGFFFRWEGSRQNVAGPSNITIRLEKGLAWDRVALLSGGIFLLLLGVVWKWRRRVRQQSEMSRTQIVQLEQRVASAEKVGSLAKTLGEYQVVARLGSGAMGVVYKVVDQAGDIFAAKVPNEMDDRVLREAEVSASLKSPHIVESYGMIEGEPNFLLMEYLDGETLQDWMSKNARVSFPQLASFVSQLLVALETAHDQGVYHRDIKPENLFLAKVDGDTKLKVMDFGLASALDAARLTRTGEAMGTPVYASPEQLSGTPVDATTDLYSVGVLIFEMATGSLPWDKTDPVALTVAKFKPLPKQPIEIRHDIPVPWNQLVLDLLQGDPKDRPASAGEVRKRWESVSPK